MIVLTEAGYRCAIPTCQTILATDLHHLVGVSNDGDNNPNNLLALCPTCHGLYHKGIISKKSLIDYKERIQKLNSIDFEEAIKKEVKSEINTIDVDKKNTKKQFGFADATYEFLQRTYELGFLDGRRFIKTGCCCYINDRVLITSGEVIDLLYETLKYRKGTPTIMTYVGLATFKILEKIEWANLVFLKSEEINTDYWEKISETPSKRFLPLQTPIKARMAPYVGESVGLVHSPYDTEHMVLHRFQFEKAEVSFWQKTEPLTFHNFVLTPICSHLDYSGAPVFSEVGELLGIVRGIMKIKDETGYRLVVGSLMKVKRLFKDI